MKRSVVLALLLAVYSGVAATAQTFSLITGRQRVTSLDGLWRFHIGDNPAWADPNFDDSTWPLIRSDAPFTKQGYPAFTGYAWYRFKVDVPGDGRPAALLLIRIANGYQLYINGKFIGSGGSATPTRDPLFAAPPATFPLPVTGNGPQSVQIALRVWTYKPMASWIAAGTYGRGNEAGDPTLLSFHRDSSQSRRALEYVNEYAYGLFAGLIGLAILALFLYRRSDKEYLWFSIFLLGEFTNAFLHLMLNLGSIPMPLWDTLRLIVQAVSTLAALAFFSIVLHARRSFFWRAVCVAALASILSGPLIYFQWASMGISYAIAEACTIPAFAWIIANLFIGAFRRDISARLLLVPAALFYGMGCVDLTTRIVWQLTGSDYLPLIDPTVFRWPFPINLYYIICFIFLLALLIFLVRRFSLARKEEERLAGEFEAAKSMQSLLVPATVPSTPGFAIENVYLPAQEVGGDFFQVLPAADGSLLIVVGDVSGKGLKAAMTVSAIVGALHGCTVRSPANVLAYLNHALRGQMTGFFTCSAALLDTDGKLTIANAGHLSPYLNGKELNVDPGLPLGITSDTEYPETVYHLNPSDRLTFVSDGVVEARTADGELYGFERTESISSQSAESIARTAQQFGQEDDITVLTVMRADAPHLQAAQ